MLTLTRDPVEGTLIRDTHHGDGSTAVLTAKGWRRGRSTGCWHLPHRRDHTPITHLTDHTTTALATAGFTVHTRAERANASNRGEALR